MAALTRPLIASDTLEKLRTTLREFAVDERDETHFGAVSAVKVPFDSVSFPTLALVVLEEVLDIEAEHRPYDKTHWTISFRFRENPASLSLQKSGLRLRCAGQDTEVRDLLVCLRKAVAMAEKRSFRTIVASQISAGAVTVENLAQKYRQMYDFFRDLATSTFSTKPTGSEVAEHLNKRLDLDRKGFYYGLSALDAYFSWLEHILVLLLPFAEYDRTSDDLLAFIGADWATKFKRVCPPEGEAKRLLDELKHVKEHIRNLNAHGGFAKKGASLLVHFVHSAVPAKLSEGTMLSVLSYELSPITWLTVVGVLSRADLLLDEAFPEGMAFVRSGLPLSFAEHDLAVMTGHIGDPAAFAGWLDGYSEYLDQIDNADF